MGKLSDGQGPGSGEKVTVQKMKRSHKRTNNKARAVATEWPGTY